MNDVWLNMQYEVTRLPTYIEAEAKLHWYAECGHYKIVATGKGQTVEEAKKNASLMLGQARAALHVALIGSVSHETVATAKLEI